MCPSKRGGLVSRGLTAARQRNMDYVLHWILAYLNGLTCILVMYDVMCQYFTNLYRRFRDSPSLTMPDGLTFMRGIGQFHVHGHIPPCFPRFSSNFIRGAGMQDGEIIETLWNKTNAISESTRGMSSAHRREVIDDTMNDSNWMKLTRISTSFPTPVKLQPDSTNSFNTQPEVATGVQRMATGSGGVQ